MSEHPVQGFADKTPIRSYTENGEQVVVVPKEVFQKSFYRLILGLQ